MAKEFAAAENLRFLVEELKPGLIDFRHELHSHPEPGYGEKRTSSLIRDILSGEALSILPPFLETDTVCILEGDHAGPTVLLRADIDALCMNDESGTPWRSVVDGMHHGCGHDGHTSMLVGAAITLSRMKKNLHGRVIFVFQPAEEGGGGAKRLLDAGLFDVTGKPDGAFALHGWPGLPEGVLHSRPGPLMAGQDRFYIDVEGTGGHGAMPHLSHDPIISAASLVCELQSIVSREYNPLHPAVLSVCTIHGGTAENIIPATVSLSGTTRYMDAEGQTFFENRIGAMTENICTAGRTRGILRYEHGYIALVNNSGMVDFCAHTIRTLLGNEKWSGGIDPYMTSEDFAYFLDKVPGAMLLLGLGEDHSALHSPTFDFNDQVITTGVSSLAGIALSFEKEHEKSSHLSS